MEIGMVEKDEPAASNAVDDGIPRKEARLNFRVTPEEAEKIKQAAKADRERLSDWLRRAALRHAARRRSA